MSRQHANEQDSRPPAPFSHHESRSHEVQTPQSPGAGSQMPLLTSATNPHRAREANSRGPASDLSLPRVSTLTHGDFSAYSPRSTTLPGLQRAHTPHSEDESSRRRKLPRVDSIVPHVTAEGSDSGSSRSAQQRLLTLSPSPHTSGPVDHFPRPIMTARSPLHKARSFAHFPHLHHLQPPTGTIPADLNPFPGASSADRYLSESNTSSITTQSDPQPRSGYSFTPTILQPPGRPSSRPSPTSSTQSPVFRHPLGGTGSTSPSGSYFSSSQQDRNSPIAPLRPSVTSMPMQLPRYASSTGTMDDGSQVKQEQDRPEGSVPMPTPGEGGTYKMMNFDTGTGLLAVPVEVGAASKASDEKRKRNAGASARFRERRKRKEMEASAAIRKLERQVKDLTEDRDFYMRERDYFSTVLFRQPGAERLPPRPQSPRISRPAPLPIRASELRSFDYDDEPSLSPEDNPGRREVFRRTSTPDPRYEELHSIHPKSPLPGTSSAHPWPTPVQQQYPTAPYHEMPPSHPAYRSVAMTVPRVDRAEFRDAGPPHPHPAHFHGPPPSVMQAAPTTGPFNPFHGHSRGQNNLGQSGQPRPRHDQR